MRKFVTEGVGLPKWPSPISHAVVVDNICYLSGQLSIGPGGEYLPGTIREEAERAFGNLFAAVRAAEFFIEDIVFVDIAFVDLDDVAEVNKLYAARSSFNLLRTDDEGVDNGRCGEGEHDGDLALKALGQ